MIFFYIFFDFIIVLTVFIMTEFIKMCYYSAWAAYRDGDQALKPEDVDAHHCTHLALAYGTIDASGKRVKFPDVFEDMHLYVIFLGSILIFPCSLIQQNMHKIFCQGLLNVLNAFGK